MCLKSSEAPDLPAAPFKAMVPAAFLMVVFTASAASHPPSAEPFIENDIEHKRSFLQHQNLCADPNIITREPGSSASRETAAESSARRQEVLAAMQTVMGPIPGAERRTALAVHVEEELDCGWFIRQFITYQSEPGSRVPAYLLIPKEIVGSRKKRPGILCLHPTDALGHKVVVGLAGDVDNAYALELTRRGYVCLAPAYPLLANYHPDLKALGYESGTMKAIWDNIRGLDLLESLPFVRKGRFGAIGHSLGGHNAVFTAVVDERLKVVASSCGLDSFVDYKDGDITGWTSIRYMPKLRNYAPNQYPFDFDGLIAALAPRTCFISAPVGDTNFKWESVKKIGAAAHNVYRSMGAAENLEIIYPDCGHQFPEPVRDAAYRRIARVLRN